ncbi:hypothetical protein [Halobaculum sp. MBLA0143]|uniref:DUF7311 family protein n=1 Tax=Halobaculum sp. MBLA0143 TaxID=3079933 RepID=UPI0035243936
MIRAVTAALVALALFAVAAPAVRDVRAARGDAVVDRLDRRLTRAVTGLVRTEAPVPPPVPGPRRLLSVDVPPPSPTRAAVDRLRLRCRGPRRLAVTASVGGRRRTAVVESPVRLAVAGGEPRGRLAHDTTLRVSFRLFADGPAVVVGEASSTVTRPPVPCWNDSDDSGRTDPTEPASVASSSTERRAWTTPG